jgi:hypothetical protein
MHWLMWILKLPFICLAIIIQIPFLIVGLICLLFGGNIDEEDSRLLKKCDKVIRILDTFIGYTN